MCLISKNLFDRKGFSLIELAVVLVLIGILISVGMKGRELIENARVKGEIEKIQKIRSAVSAYFEKYTNLPGDINYNGIIDSAETQGAVAALEDEGLVSKKDFKTVIGNGYYMFHQCGADFSGGGRLINSGTNTCMRPVVDPGLDIDIPDNTTDTGSPQLWCILEVSIDDKTVLSGTIRQWEANIVNFAIAINTLDAYGQCLDESKTASGQMAVVVW